MSVSARPDPERVWLAVVGTIVGVLVVGSALLPRVFYDDFVWHYFWGPVVADANDAFCAVKTPGGVTFHSTAAACDAAAGIVAHPGYTFVSEIGYAVTLVVMLVGVVFLLRRLDIGDDRGFFFALLPYMFLGGALRVVEDADNAIPPGVEAGVHYPWNALIISPIIYFTMFAFTLAAILVSLWLARSGRVESYERPLAAIGAAGLVLTLGYLGFLAANTAAVGFYPQVAVVVLVATSVIVGGLWSGLDRWWPTIFAGTGLIGIAVLWAHTLDGVSNVVGIDWGAELGLPYGDLVPKHPVNRALIGVGQRFPAAVRHVVGTAWPFLLVKIAAALFVVSLFDETIFEENPRYAILLLVAIVAVGLGPGTRDMLRATFGV